MLYQNLISISQKKILNKLAMALGYYNITKISNCMSRIRIEVVNPSLLACDKSFLLLNTQGIIREDNFIHLIYGKISSQLAFQLNLLYKALNNTFTLELINLLQGSKNIQKLTHTDKQITIFINDSIEINQQLLQDLSHTHNIIIQQKNNSILLLVDQNMQEIFTIIQYTLLFWDTIQSLFIINTLKISNITNITRTNYTLKIDTAVPIAINTTIWGYYGLETSPNSVSENEIYIHNISNELFESLLEYYHFLINGNDFFDKKSLP
ncbi:MAG: PTS transporter subunit EIIB [Spirochaetota bacterium]|nr:PTS transporter subunit EIIB [Spirochaetota bacterium]